jgi:hypothetical protein
MAQDDWRVTVTLHDAVHVGPLRVALHEQQAEEEASRTLGRRVAVGGGEEPGVIFLYADAEATAREAEQAVRELVRRHGFEADFAVHRWHPLEERWEDADVPLPGTESEREVERERREQEETAESEQLRAGLWEVRIELASHGDAVALAERLEAEADSLVPGWTFSVARRWRYLLIGADNEEQANELAARLRQELPAGATIHAEPSGALAWRAVGTRFAVFGGLGS